MLTRKTIGCLVIAAVAAAGGGYAYAQASGPSSADGLPPATAAETANAWAKFSSLQNGAKAVPMPAAAAQMQESVLPAGAQFDGAKTRLIRDESVLKEWVFGNAGVICTFRQLPAGGGGECMSEREMPLLAAGRLGPSIDVIDQGYLVSGLVPDGTSNAVAQFDDGHVEAIAIRNNVAAIETTVKPIEVRWTAPDGSNQKFPISEGSLDG